MFDRPESTWFRVVSPPTQGAVGAEIRDPLLVRRSISIALMTLFLHVRCP
jgi:hypothetical protein